MSDSITHKLGIAREHLFRIQTAKFFQAAWKIGPLLPSIRTAHNVMLRNRLDTLSSEHTI